MRDKHLKDELKHGLKDSIKDHAKSSGKALKNLIRDLTPEQRDELMRRLRETKKSEDDLQAREAGTSPPLSFAQEREWFRYRRFPGVAHNLAGALRLEGKLAIETLTRALGEIVRRHETLRASFSESGVTIRDAAPLTIDIVESSEDAWPALYAAEMAKPFDLERDTLLRATLVKLASETHILLLTLHHIAADGWSIGVVMNELVALYSGKAVPELRIQYGDFAAWQRKRDIDGKLEYWRKQLSDLPPALELTPDCLLHDAPSNERDHDAARHLSMIDEARRQQLEELGRREDTTLFVTLLTAFFVLMMRWSGRDDLAVGSPVSGRTRVETERLVGLFLNTLALRVRLTRDLTFLEAMSIVRQAVLDGLEHADVPVERIVQDLGIERSANAHPLYETIFNFTPSAPRRVELPGLTARLEDAPALIEEFSTQLFVTDLDGNLELDLRYRKQRYSDARMARFAEQYHAILAQAVRDPDTRLGAFELATGGVPDPTLVLEKPPQRFVPGCIDDWVARTPDAIAVAQGNVALTYREFGARIDALAQTLRAGEVHAVRGKRTIDTIVAMAATLKAGAVLLTLSHDLPEQRQQAMLRTVVPAAPNAAYLFFTSGTTGTPKAILGTHEGLAHWLAWQRETFAVGAGDRCGQLTGLSFDVVLRDVFLALTSGATLVLPTEDDLASAGATLRWLERERITLTHSVPAVAETWLLAKPHDVTLANLKRIFFAGEPLTASLVARWRNAFPRAGEIVNVYGPTETTLAKCFYRVPAHPRAGVQPLGNTIPNAQALVLTPERRLCGVGEPGEIAIRTPFRSLGYVNASDENAKRFIANPFRDDPDDLLYLTGDRGTIGGDGLLEFGGRVDHQVKIRGVRVEPMEVTVTLQSAPDVASCAVIARDEDGSGPMLVAYVVPKAGAPPNVGTLQDFLAQRLPAAMVPSAFVFLDALPLTSNQKLDRDRLPAPDSARPQVESKYVPPRDAVELQLVAIWEELLNVRPIGVTDRFFEVGGHSLLALRLLVEVEQRLGTKVPLPALFEEPTIAHLARVLRNKMDEWPLLVTLRAGDHARRLFLVHPGGGILWNYVHLVRHLPPNVAVYGLQARGLDGKSLPHDDLERLAHDYVAEVRRIQPHGPYLLAGHSLGGMIAFEMARQLEDVSLLAMFDSALPRERSAFDDARSLADMARTVERFAGTDLGITVDKLRTLSADEQVEYVANALGHDVAMTRNLLHVSRAHIEASRAYRARTTSVPITLIRAKEANHAIDETLGWGALAPVRLLWAPGDHVTMMSEPHVQQLAATLAALL